MAWRPSPEQGRAAICVRAALYALWVSPNYYPIPESDLFVYRFTKVKVLAHSVLGFHVLINHNLVRKSESHTLVCPVLSR